MRDLSRIDWNLIPALDALLTERNVSRAARRLGVTQPAASHALARLRRHFGDDLLVRRGNAYLLTPTAERLAPLVRQAVSASTSAMAAVGVFDPRSCTQRFTVAASEYAQTSFMPALARALADVAPGATLDVVTPFAEPFRTAEDVVLGTDGWVAPREVLVGYPSTGMLADRWVCVVADDNAGVGEDLSLDNMRDLRWVAPTVRGEPLRLHLDGLAAVGVEPVLALTTPSFASVPFLVAGTDRIGLLQHSLASLLAAQAGVRVLECPWSVQALHLTFWWDKQYEEDPAHRWLRALVEDTMRDVDRTRAAAALGVHSKAS